MADGRLVMTKRRKPRSGPRALTRVPEPSKPARDMLDGNIPERHIPKQVVDVVGTDEFTDWFRALDEAEQDGVAFVVDLLEEKGASLPFPHSSAIAGSRIALRELRVQGKTLRVFYAFDPERQAVLLIGGDKSGDKKFYERMIALAERIWGEYLKEAGL